MPAPQQLSQPLEERKVSNQRTVTSESGQTKIIEEVKKEEKKEEQKAEVNEEISDEEEEKIPEKVEPPSKFTDLAEFKKDKLQGVHKQEVTSVHF